MRVAMEFYGTQNKNDCIPKDVYASFRKPMGVFPRRILVFFTIAISLSIFWLLLSYDRLPSFLSVELTTSTTTHWHGWANIENLIVLYATNS